MTGFLTNLGIGVAIFTLIMVIAMNGIISMSNEYDLDVGNLYSNDYNAQLNEIQTITYDSLKIREQGGIDADTTDIAQAKGVLSAENEKIKYSNIIQRTGETLQNIIPFNPAITVTMATVLAILIGAASTFLILGRKP